MTETLHQATEAYLKYLKAQGKKEATLFTYGKGALGSANQ